jgi:hypothetical protein
MKKRSLILSVVMFLAVCSLLGRGGPASADQKVPAHLAARVTAACDAAATRGVMDPVAGVTRTKLLQLANAPCLRVQTCAIYALGELAEPRAVEALRGKLASPDPHVRRIAATALGKIGDPRALPEIITLSAEGGERLAVRSASVRALGQFQDQRAAEALRRLAASDAGPVAVDAADALQRMESFLLWSGR